MLCSSNHGTTKYLPSMSWKLKSYFTQSVRQSFHADAGRLIKQCCLIKYSALKLMTLCANATAKLINDDNAMSHIIILVKTKMYCRRVKLVPKITLLLCLSKPQAVIGAIVFTFTSELQNSKLYCFFLNDPYKPLILTIRGVQNIHNMHNIHNSDYLLINQSNSDMWEFWDLTQHKRS